MTTKNTDEVIVYLKARVAQLECELKEAQAEHTLSIKESCQERLMIYDPQTKSEKPYPAHASQYRMYHGQTAWIYNPWTGRARDPRDIGTDVQGCLIGG